jgi:predicted nucleic-acid-binding protein
MEIFMKDSGKKIWLMDSEFICILLELYTKAIGKTTFSMVLEFNYGQIKASIKETISLEKNMVKVNTAGQTEAFIKVLGRITKYQDLVNIFG